MAAQHFFVLPDSENAAAMVCSLDLDSLPSSFNYLSGRPAVLGNWPIGGAAVVSSGSYKCFIIGTFDSDLDPFEKALKLYISNGDLDFFTLPGSFHLILSTPQGTVVRGSLADYKRLFYTKINGVCIAASRADALASLNEASVDEVSIASRMLTHYPPHPFAMRTPWQEIGALVPGSALMLDNTGLSLMVEPYWSPPERLHSPAIGARLLRQELEAAVHARVASSAAPLSSDVTGGMDSTPLFHLAAVKDPNTVGFTTGTPATFNSEIAWAVLGIGQATMGEHLVMPSEKVPTPFDDLDQSYVFFDEPYIGEIVKKRIKTLAQYLKNHGLGQHLMGHGGDELFSMSPVLTRKYFPRRPRQAVRVLHQYYALRRVSLTDLIREVLDSRSYSAQMSASARKLRKNTGRGQNKRWSPVPADLPPWATKYAREIVAQSYAEAAKSTKRLSRDRSQHETLEKVQNAARVVRHDSELMSHFGIQAELPYFDDRVVTVVLSIDESATNDPTRYKPLLANAMKDLLPEAIRVRTTKTEGTPEIWDGLENNRAMLSTLCKDMVLEEMGLIDSHDFRNSLLGPLDPDIPIVALWNTLACEVWLRDQKKMRPVKVEKT